MLSTLQEKEAAAEQPQAKRLRVDGEESKRSAPKRIETGIFSKIPPELFHHILKFLSSEVSIFLPFSFPFS